MKKLKDVKFSKKMVIFVIVFMSLFYISAVVYQFTAHDSYSDALLTNVTLFFSAEGGLLAYIKGKKIKYNVNDNSIPCETSYPNEEVNPEDTEKGVG